MHVFIFLFNILFFLCDFSKSSSIKSLTTSCDETSECSGDTITDDTVYCPGYNACYGSTITISDELVCGGYFGCEYGTLSSSTSDSDIICSGVYGCRYADISISNAYTSNTQSNSILCTGFSGCYYAEISDSSLTTNVGCDSLTSCGYATITAYSIDCDGSYSCAGATLSAGSKITAHGPWSANEVTITSTTSIESGGYYALSGSTISSLGLDRLTLYGTGNYSLYGATLYCYGNSSCSVYCRAGPSCDGLIYYCYDGASCSISCNDHCTDCPDIDYVDSSNTQLIKNNKDTNKDEQDVLRLASKMVEQLTNGDKTAMKLLFVDQFQGDLQPNMVLGVDDLKLVQGLQLTNDNVATSTELIFIWLLLFCFYCLCRFLICYCLRLLNCFCVSNVKFEYQEIPAKCDTLI